MSFALAIFFGAIQGYLGGYVDLFGQRLSEIWSSLPELLILIILTSLFSPSIYVMLFFMAGMNWMGISAYVRAEYLKARELDFVSSATALGAPPPRIMFKHILPNTLAPLLTFSISCISWDN